MRAAAAFVTTCAALLLAACGDDHRPAGPAANLAPLENDYDATLVAARADGRPIVALVREAGDEEGIDASAWLADDAAARAAAGDAHLVLVWKTHPSLPASLRSPKLDGSQLALLTATGDPLGNERIPSLRARLPETIAKLRGDPMNVITELESAVYDPAAAPRARATFAALMAQPLARDLLVEHAGHLAWLSREFGTREQRHALAARMLAVAANCRASADGFLDLADAAYAEGDVDEAQRLWQCSQRAAEGESPSVAATARAMAALASTVSSPARAAWERRAVVEAVALVPDLPTYVATIAQWRHDRFFPVLFQDDRYAPRFIAAFKPSRVVVVPSVIATGAADQPATIAPEALRAALLASWSGGSDGAVDDERLRARLRELGLQPEGVVFTEPDAAALAGGLALAAGRFQGLELLPAPRIGIYATPATTADKLDGDDARAFARQVGEGLARWPGTGDGAWRAITLAAAYPYRYVGKEVWGDVYALDDLLGRDESLVRTAVAGRLVGDQAQSAYQAMCSLFLQPRSALLFDTYDQEPMSQFGHYRMAGMPEVLSPRLRAELVTREPVAALRQRTLPWSRWDAVVITSSGGPTDWSAPEAAGASDDVPVGMPYLAHMTHSNSAADPYDADTIAGRALWGGAYFWFGSCAEPFLNAFQSADYAGRRIAAGAPLGATFRARLGQAAPQPWRLMVVGDPLCCLRREPMRRDAAPTATLAAENELALVDGGGDSWSEKLRQARWRGDRRAAQALMADMPETEQLSPAEFALALEECLLSGDGARAETLWSAASADARKDAQAQRHARLAIGWLMDQAQARGDREAFMAGLGSLLTAAPAANAVERWVGIAVALAKRDHAEDALRAWLPPSPLALSDEIRKVLARANARLDFERALADGPWRDAAALALTTAADAVAALARAGGQDLDERVDALVVRCHATMGTAETADIVKAIGASAVAGAERLNESLKTIDARKTFFRDWLLLGPFAQGDHGSWERLEAHAGVIDPQAAWADGERQRVWERPFTPRDTGFIDLAARFEPKIDVRAYATAAILVDRGEAHGWLLLGSDDGIVAWLDGVEIHRNPAPRALTADEDQVRIAPLTPGHHTLLLRIDQRDGGWGFCARLAADRQGTKPMVGARLVNPLVPELTRPLEK